jgi:DNA (cytosine-5)-methyltransferase 1
VDIKPQPRYCGDAFIQADAMTFPLEGYDFIWASPPCQKYSWSTARHRNKGKVYPDLLGSVGSKLRALETPYTIENVVGSARELSFHFMLCGSMFNLGVQRHRLFETSFFCWVPEHPSCNLPDADLVSVTGHGRWYRKCTVAGHGSDGPHYSLDVWKEAMGIDWMARDELTQSIPPAYSQYIAEQFLATACRSREQTSGVIGTRRGFGKSNE